MLSGIAVTEHLQTQTPAESVIISPHRPQTYASRQLLVCSLYLCSVCFVRYILQEIEDAELHRLEAWVQELGWEVGGLFFHACSPGQAQGGPGFSGLRTFSASDRQGQH